MGAAEAFERLQKDAVLSDVIARLEEIFSPLIDEYVADRGPGVPPGESKAFKDAVWGMIDLTGSEVVVVDSPPLQRLRRVRQLGFGYLTYPTAGHTRLEHTLGAVHQTERMLTAIRRRSKPNLQRDISEALRVVRLAALLHDCGHMPASHVSERFFEESECPDPPLRAHAKAIRSAVIHAFRASSNVRLAECLSVCLIATPSFYELLRTEARYEPEEIATAALAIAGTYADPGKYFVSQIISNAIDADKLDYMFRDSLFTRVPLGIDLERLLFKLKCEEVSARDLPVTASRGMQKDSRPRVLATDISGDSLAYDVSHAREMLYARVYFHHKTRAAERIALQILEQFRPRPEDLLEFDDSYFSEHALAEGGAITASARKLIWRRLPRRGLAISDLFLDPPAEERKVQWARLDDALSDPDRRKHLEQEILREVEWAADLLKRAPAEDIYLDPRAQNPAAGSSSLLVGRPDGTFGPGQGFPPDAAAETLDPTDAAYVFFSGGGATAELVYIAAERVFARDFELHFHRGAADLAKVDIKKVIELKRDLEEKDSRAFDDFGRLRPGPALVDDASLAERIEAIGAKFHHYTTVPEVKVGDERVREFLAQFPEPLVEPMLTVLEHIVFLNRAKLGAEFASALAEKSADDAVFVPLTFKYGKSATHIPYFLSDHHNLREIVDLLDALKVDKPLVIFDDVLVSGTQSVKILKTWFNQRNPPYKGEPVLTPEQQGAMRGRSVRFHFAWAWKKGIKRLVKQCEDLGIDAEVDAVVIDESGPALDQAGTSDAAALREFLREVGTSLLLSTKGEREHHSWSQEKCERSALGYNNDERLVVIEYNTPTGTITPLWSRGSYRNAPWIPLFPRRERVRDEDQEQTERGEVVVGEG
ncbi:MAG: HD domain-containing protein [Actinomycetota bacterium]|nr:HD domain-containing protein [Actinomycetota bacterium]